MFELLSAFGGALGIVVAVVAVVLLVLIYARSVYRNAGPDEALIITGRRPKRTTAADGSVSEESGIKVVHGSGVFLTPFFQKAAKLSLTSRAIEIQTTSQDTNGVTIDIEAVALVKVGDRDESIRAAGQRFLGQERNIDEFAREVLSGSLRASIGATDVATIIRKRDDLTTAVLDVAKEALANQGLDVDSFEIKGISDKNEYIRDLGRAEQAKVRLAAEVAETEATRRSREAAVAAEQAVAEAENTLALRRAALQLETDRAVAEASAARPLAEAKAQQAVVAEQQLTAQKRAELRAAELASEVGAVADANAYQTRVEAEAAAAAERQRAQAAAEARTITAEAIRAEGEAEAAAIRARGLAEAEATKAQAAALAEQSDQLIQVKLIETLPALARELAAPMSNIDSLTVVSTDGAGALPKQVVKGFAEVDSLLEGATGVSLRTLVNGAVSGSVAGRAVASQNGETTHAH